MNITLTSELKQFVIKMMRSGLYQSESEVVSEGLRLLKENEELQTLRLEELKKDILVGIEQADRNELMISDKIFKRLRGRTRHSP